LGEGTVLDRVSSDVMTDGDVANDVSTGFKVGHDDVLEVLGGGASDLNGKKRDERAILLPW